MPQPRKITYGKITFRAVPMPDPPDPLTDMLSAVKKLAVDQALEVTCVPAQLGRVRQRVAVMGANQQFTRHIIHTRRTGAGAFMVWLTPRSVKRSK